MTTTDGSLNNSRRNLQATGLILLFLIYFLHEFPEYLAGNVKYAGMALLSVLLMLILVSLSFDDLTIRMVRSVVAADRVKLGKRFCMFVMIGLASLTHLNQVLLDHRMYFQARIVMLPLSKANLLVWGIMTAGTLVLLVRVPRTYTPIFILAILWGVLLRLMILHTVAYDPEAADMLFCIDRTAASVLRGVNPYAGQTCEVSPTHSFPLAYFPLLWLPYVPFKALGLNIRWFNLLAQLGLLAFVWHLIGRKNQSATRSLVLLILILLPDMVWTFFYRQVSHYWLLGAVYLWLVWRERWNLSLLAVSGLVLMRITALTTLLVYLLYVWKRRGLRIAAVHAAVVAAVFVLFFAPFSGIGLARFKFLFFDEFVQYAAEIGWQTSLAQLSMGGILKAVGLTRLIIPLQVGGLLLMGLLYRLSSDRSFRMFAGLTATAYAYFLWLSGFIASYYWFFPLVMLSTRFLIESQETKRADFLVSGENDGRQAGTDVIGAEPGGIAVEDWRTKKTR
jgi:hypothetical protein